MLELPNDVIKAIFRIIGAKCRWRTCIVSKRWYYLTKEISIACSNVSNARMYYDGDKCSIEQLHMDYHLWKRSGEFLNVQHAMEFGDIDIIMEADKFLKLFSNKAFIQNHINTYLYDACNNPVSVDYMIAKLEKLPGYTKYGYNQCFMRACWLGNIYVVKLLSQKFTVSISLGFTEACKASTYLANVEIVKYLWDIRTPLFELNNREFVRTVANYIHMNKDVFEFIQTLIA